MDTQEYARDILRKYWDGKLPVNPVAIAEKIGFKVYPTFSLPEGQSGFCDIENHKIFIRADEPHKRQRYSIAHEIGHAVLGHGSCARSSEQGKRNTIEREADRFAAELIMPSVAMETLVKFARFSYDKLCDTFDVSHNAMNIRLIELGYV